MTLETALFQLTLNKGEGREARVYEELLTAYQKLARKLNVPTGRLMGATLLLGIEKLDRLNSTLDRLIGLYNEMKDLPCRKTLFMLITDFSGKDFHPSRTRPAWVFVPADREVPSTFELNYRLAYGLTVSTTAKALGLDEIGSSLLEELDKILEAEIRIKENWLKALGSSP